MPNHSVASLLLFYCFTASYLFFHAESYLSSILFNSLSPFSFISHFHLFRIFSILFRFFFVLLLFILLSCFINFEPFYILFSLHPSSLSFHPSIDFCFTPFIPPTPSIIPSSLADSSRSAYQFPLFHPSAHPQIFNPFIHSPIHHFIRPLMIPAPE